MCFHSIDKSIIETNMFLHTIYHQLRLPFILLATPEHSFESRGIVFRRGAIGMVLAIRRGAKVIKRVVCSHSIDMVNDPTGIFTCDPNPS